MHERYITYLKQEKQRAEELLQQCLGHLDRTDPLQAQLQNEITQFFSHIHNSYKEPNNGTTTNN